MLQGLVPGPVARLATGFGGLMALPVGTIRRNILDFILGAVSGIMLTVSFVSLTAAALQPP